MRRTRSDRVQFRLLLADYAVLQRLADAKGITPKDYVIALTIDHIEAERTADERADASA